MAPGSNVELRAAVMRCISSDIYNEPLIDSNSDDDDSLPGWMGLRSTTRSPEGISSDIYSEPLISSIYSDDGDSFPAWMGVTRPTTHPPGAPNIPFFSRPDSFDSP